MQTFVFGSKEPFQLRDGITYLNHGAFGATPKVVSKCQQEWRDEFEAQPFEFFIERIYTELRTAAGNLAGFVNASESDVVFIRNTTEGISTVLNAIELPPGATILCVDHAYGAVRIALEHWCRLRQWNLEVLETSELESEKSALEERVCGAIHTDVSLCVIDHISSTSAVVMPVKEITEKCREVGALVLVDGAHAPGQLSLDLKELDVDYYMGNCHKWLFAPKGSALLWVHPRHQDRVRPLSVSWWHEESFAKAFDYCGTYDPSAYLAVSTSLNFVDSIGFESILKYNTGLCDFGINLLEGEFGYASITPKSSRANMATIRHPLSSEGTLDECVRLHARLWEVYAIEVPVVPWKDQSWIRISAQIYNSEEDFEYLCEALRRETK